MPRPPRRLLQDLQAALIYIQPAIYPLAISQQQQFYQHGQQQLCPPLQAPCRCAPSIYEPVAILCEMRQFANALQAIQIARNIRIDSLAIVDTAISSLPANAFNDFTILRKYLKLLPRLRNLRKLYLNRNRISQIQQQAFAGFASREVLLKMELAGNKLTDEALGGGQDVFSPLRSLQELSLETNALTQVPSQALEAQRNTLTNLNLGLNQTLGIGETPIAVIPANAFVHTPSLMRLEMSEAAVDTIELGAFQRTPLIQAIVLNKNRLTKVRSDMFQGLNDLYSWICKQ
uniref:Uncharacterized protein n=1 Tax=Ditylenchus dipsaci TaxID=166011 RepID=A0A915EDZ0_9BILA